MSLTNMKVFNEQLQTMTIETLAQQVDKFNEASAWCNYINFTGV